MCVYLRAFCDLCIHVNPLPNNKIWDVTKLKAFADDKLKVAKMTFSLFDRVENNFGKKEDTGYLFPQCFPKLTSLGSSIWLLVELEFNATLTAKVISWQSVTHMCFLAFSHWY